MRLAWAAVLISALLMSTSPQLRAEVTQGLGLGGGASTSTYSEPGLTIAFVGTAFAFDYQIPVNPEFTVNPFVMIVQESGEDVTFYDPFYGSITVGTELGYQIFGAQFRFWPTAQFFVGGQLAQHSVTLTVTDKTSGLGSASDTETVMAVGFLAGAQLGPVQALVVRDSLSIQGSDIVSLRYVLTYRVPTQ